jgi:hypothetical protein
VTFVKSTDSTNYSQSSALFEKLEREAKETAKELTNKGKNKKPEKSRDNSVNNYKL